MLTIILLIISANYSISATTTTTTDSFEDIFKSSAIINTGVCSFQCREVKSGYGTQITSIDIPNGRTFCKVFPKNNYKAELKYEAGTINEACVKEWENRITETPSTERKYNVSSSISYVDNDKEITLSRFLSAMVKL